MTYRESDEGYKEVGEVDDHTIRLLKCHTHGQWQYSRDSSRRYELLQITPEDVEEILPIFESPIQQFFLRISPKGFVHPHVDKRKGITYHVPVTTNKNCWCYMHSLHGDDRFHLEVGKIYEVDRTIEHSSKNLGSSDRIHLLVEVEHAIE